MSVKTEFNQAVSAVEQILGNAPSDPRSVRESIKMLVNAYRAKEVVSNAYKAFEVSGVMQWKTFLRAANVQKDENIGNYVQRIRLNLDEMHNFDVKHLKP